MNVIQPNCRVRFTADDVDFVVSVLNRSEGDSDTLVGLLADEDTRDMILDDERLYQALLERRGCLKVSCHFYFYVLVRQVFRKSGIEDRAVADYVAEVLAEFSRIERLHCQVPGQAGPLEYFTDLLAALRTADDHTSFCIRAHIGNHSLFLAGVFAERIRHRAERKGFPDLSYYEELGRMNYRVAGDHRLARRFELAPIFATLSERFQTTRLALNDLSDRLISVGDNNRSVNALLLQFGNPPST